MVIRRARKARCGVKPSYFLANKRACRFYDRPFLFLAADQKFDKDQKIVYLYYQQSEVGRPGEGPEC